MRDDQLKNEAVYDQVRADQYLWARERATGLSRRQLLKLMATGAGAAALGFLPGATRRAQANHVTVVKPTPPEQFRILGTNREMLWEVMQGQDYVVPNANFFVRNHTSTPHIPAGPGTVDTWRLRIEGSGIAHPLDLTYDEILNMPSVTATKFIECAGNGRSFFGTQQGITASGSQWRLGAIGVAEWTGVPLSAILELAGVRPTAVDVMPVGLDPVFFNPLPPPFVPPPPLPNPSLEWGHIQRPLSIEKALDDTLLVYAMNGQKLPEDHGFPVRFLVPGWVGIASIKWVGRIEVSEQPLVSPWNDIVYRLFGPAYPGQPVIDKQVIKSAFELPWDAHVPAGPHTLTGRSWSGHNHNAWSPEDKLHKIEKVDVSFDGGTNWLPATLDPPNIQRAWVRWHIHWVAQPGQYHLMARATDKKGNVQPDSVPHNLQGYLFGAIVKHPVTVP